MTSPRFTLALKPIVSIGSHFHLLKEFIVRDVKGRFAGSMAGIFWTLINPLATILVYFFIFSIIFRIRVKAEETGTNSFVVFFLAGYFPWLLFSEALTRSAGILLENTSMITKVVFPVELLPASAVLATIMINGFGLVVYIGYILAKGYGSVAWLWFGALFTAQLFFTFGLAYFLAAFCVFVRDVKEILTIVIMIWFHVTPIIYPLSLVPAAARPIMLWNPMAMFVLLYRDAFLLHQMHWLWLMRLAVISLISYVLGAWFFMRARPAFGDVL
jgi:lipopolysaccharide transport system permease protein